MDNRRTSPVMTGTVQQERPDSGTRIAILVGAARQGSEDALGQIVTELSPLLWQVARAAATWARKPCSCASRGLLS